MSTLITRSLERDSYSPDQDAIALILDTLNDNRAAFGFIVSSAGLRTDIAIFDDAETGSTPWNAFWDVAIHRNPDGRSAEIRIPFPSLGYKTKDGHAEMGLILWRYIIKNVEYDIFPVRPKSRGKKFSSRQTIRVLTVASSFRPYLGSLISLFSLIMTPAWPLSGSLHEGPVKTHIVLFC